MNNNNTKMPRPMIKYNATKKERNEYKKALNNWKARQQAKLNTRKNQQGLVNTAVEKNIEASMNENNTSGEATMNENNNSGEEYIEGVNYIIAPDDGELTNWEMNNYIREHPNWFRQRYPNIPYPFPNQIPDGGAKRKRKSRKTRRRQRK